MPRTSFARPILAFADPPASRSECCRRPRRARPRTTRARESCAPPMKGSPSTSRVHRPPSRDAPLWYPQDHTPRRGIHRRRRRHGTEAAGLRPRAHRGVAVEGHRQQLPGSRAAVQHAHLLPRPRHVHDAVRRIVVPPHGRHVRSRQKGSARGGGGRRRQDEGPRVSPDGKWEAIVDNFNVAVARLAGAAPSGRAPMAGRATPTSSGKTPASNRPSPCPEHAIHFLG